MKITVAIAVYNGAATLRTTLESVLSQTVSPHEILVVNDGSTDETSLILKLYKPQVTVVEQENKGLSAARNVLCKRAQGDLIAFLDADDVWHPQYLQTQQDLFKSHPTAVAFFTGHTNFTADQDIRWCHDDLHVPNVELIEPANFLKRYTTATGPFASPSYCCVPKSTLQAIGKEPFDNTVRVCDDAYLFYLLALKGPILYCPTRLVAYRFTPGSLSSNRLRNLDAGVRVFELLEERYKTSADKRLLGEFQVAFASKRREYAKLLMGVGKSEDAQRQLCRSLKHSVNPEAICKGLALLLLSHMPARLQPTWPSAAVRPSVTMSSNVAESAAGGHVS